MEYSTDIDTNYITVNPSEMTIRFTRGNYTTEYI